VRSARRRVLEVPKGTVSIRNATRMQLPCCLRLHKGMRQLCPAARVWWSLHIDSVVTADRRGRWRRLAGGGSAG